MADEMMLIPKADLVAGYDAIRAKGVPGLTKSGELAGKITSIKGGFPNGTDWERANITSGQFNVVQKVHGIWLASFFDFGGGPYYGVYWSEDGKTWNKSNIDNEGAAEFLYFGSAWVTYCPESAAGLYYSSDGKTWTEVIGPGSVYWVIRLKGKLIAESSANSQFYESSDGINWTAKGPVSVKIYPKPEVGNDICVGFKAGRPAKIYYSSDGTNWQLSDRPEADVYSKYRKIKFGHGLFVSAYEDVDGVYYSEDGGKWLKSNVTGDTAARLDCVGGVWFCSGVKGIMYSYDGRNWSETNISAGPSPIDDLSVHYGNGVFVCTADSRKYYSSNGISWRGAGVSNNQVPAYGNGLWVCGTGLGGGVLHSTNGNNWVNKAIPSFPVAPDFVYSDGLWVAAGDRTGLWYSVAWEPS